jgi:hypothetical protein
MSELVDVYIDYIFLFKISITSSIHQSQSRIISNKFLNFSNLLEFLSSKNHILNTKSLSSSFAIAASQVPFHSNITFFLFLIFSYNFG